MRGRISLSYKKFQSFTPRHHVPVTAPLLPPGGHPRDPPWENAGSGDAGSGDAGSGDAGSGDAGSGDTGSGDAGSGDARDQAVCSRVSGLAHRAHCKRHGHAHGQERFH